MHCKTFKYYTTLKIKVMTNLARTKLRKVSEIFANMLDNNNDNINDYYAILSNNGLDYDYLDFALNLANNILIFK